MKKLYSAIFVTLCAGTISAQAYFPMLDSANEWSYGAHGVGVSNLPVESAPCSYPVFNGVNSFKQFTTSDTVINSTTYKIVLSSIQLCTMGYVREDTAARKVFFLDNVSSTEKLLYDFSMVVGDTMAIQFANTPGYASGVYTLDSITTVAVYAGSRSAFHLNCHAIPFSPTLTWVESVGNLNDAFYPYFDNSPGFGAFSSCSGVQYEFTQFMICFDHNYKVYFDNCAYTIAQTDPYVSYTDSCDYWSFIGAITENYTTAGFDIYPNPSQGKSTIEFEASCENDFDIYVWDIQGKMLAKQIQLGHLREGKNTMQIDLSGLPGGIYVVEIRSAESSAYSKLQLQD